jgi:hypothetical protein
MRDYEAVPEKLDGRGYVDYRIDWLPLLPGTYDVNVSIYDYNIARQYDGRVHALRFDVDRGPTGERLGVVSFNGRWEINETPEPTP